MFGANEVVGVVPLEPVPVSVVVGGEVVGMLVVDDAPFGRVVVVLVGLTTVVNVVDEDVVDSDEMTPKSMSRRCSPSSR